MSSTIGAVARGGKRFRMGVVLDLVPHVSTIALAGALYLAFSPYSRSLALLGILWRVAESTILALTEIGSVVLLAVGTRYVSATGTEAVASETLGRALIVAEDWGFKIGLALFALGSLLYGVLFVTTGAVPPALGWWGLVAGPLAVVGRWSILVTPNVPLAVETISFLPMILFEVVFGVWLLFRGGQTGS